jgi:MYXO-CTERM domain-containing protein
VLVTNHVLSGAAIGYTVRSVPTAFAVGVVSHLALDALPHWGGRPIEDVMPVAVADGLTGLAAMAWATRAAPRRDRLRVLAGMAGAAFLDLDKPSTVFFGFSPFPAAVDHVHGRVQREAPHRMPQEIATGILGAIGVAALAARARRRP